MGLNLEKYSTEQGEKENNGDNDAQEGWRQLRKNIEYIGLWRAVEKTWKETEGQMGFRGFIKYICIKIYKATVNKQQAIGEVFKNHHPKLNFSLHLSHQKLSYEESLPLPASSFLCDIMN